LRAEKGHPNIRNDSTERGDSAAVKADMQLPRIPLLIQRARVWLPLLALVAVGCGLSDYEKRIDEQKKRLEKADQENALIGEPLEAPDMRATEKKQLVAALATPVFLRPPRGVGRFADREPYVFPLKGPNQVFLYRYGAGQADKTNPKAPLPAFAAVFFADCFVKTGKAEDGPTSEEFRHNVIWALYVHNGENPPKEIASQKLEVPPLTFEAVEFPGGLKEKTPKEPQHLWYFFAYFHERALAAQGKRVAAAIIFQVPFERKDDDALRRARELSLRSLGIGDDYEKKHTAYWASRKR
jgi:hypothetical protein